METSSLRTLRRRRRPTPILAIAIMLAAAWPFWLADSAAAQDLEGVDSAPRFHEYDPPSTLVVPRTEIDGAKFPFVDVHNHQWQMPDDDVSAVAREMDALNMAVMVNLSGRGFRRAKNADGTFRLEGLPAGDWTLEAYCWSDRLLYVGQVSLAVTEGSTHDVRLELALEED